MIDIGMIEDYKKITLNTMAKLSKLIRNTPVISIDFDITAKNKNIEEYILSRIDKTDWEGRPLSEDVIQELCYNNLKRFYSSKGYNSCGVSTFTMRITFVAQDIKYDDVYELVSGNREDMPKEYNFVGNVRPSNFFNVYD